MNVLSLFDGMSCGQIALNRLGIEYDNYFASEIKKHGIDVTQFNFPKTIQLGDINNINFKDLPKIDLLIGGSPCQDFSRANMERKGLKGKKSGLFYKFEEALKILNPKWFLLENVIMDDFGFEYISNSVGTYPIRINSEKVSAQLRDRLYWTNIGPANFDLLGNRYSAIPPPIDKKIFLKDIIMHGYTDRKKSRALLESDSRPLSSSEKMWWRYKEKGFTTIVFSSEDLDYKKGIRYLNQIELERLQTVPEGYTKILSRNKAASLLGDGWTIDIICHILKYIKNEQPEKHQ